jgi:hypothetical protein
MCFINRFMAEVQGNELVSPGVIWGRPLQIIERNKHGNHIVVKREGHTAGGGRGAMKVYRKTVYMLVRLGTEHISARESLTNKARDISYGEIVEKVIPGPNRGSVKELIEKCQRI